MPEPAGVVVTARLRFPRPPALEDHDGCSEFGHVAAGATARLPIDVTVEEARALGGGLVRVLDDRGVACGAWAPDLGRDELVRGLRDMVLVREFDVAMLRAQRQGKAAFYMQSLGEEAIACAHRRALAPGDMTFPTYRQQGLLIAAGYPVVAMMDQVLSNSRDPLKGRQLPVMYSSREHGFFSVSGNLGTQYTQAVGWAMAAAIDRTDHIASAWIGEGATAESDFHAALLFASTYHVPVILNIVNNQWAISTHEGVARGAAPAFADRGSGFGIPSLRVDGNDYLAVFGVSAWAAERTRRGHGPCLVEWVTYRGGAHSTSDDPSVYRAKDAWARWPLGDPVDRLARHLNVGYGFTDTEFDALRDEVHALVGDTYAEAEAHGTVEDGPWSAPETMFEDVFATPTPALVEQRRQAGF